ncbi:MAG: hypothetical protein QXM31_03325 [Candidatus Woesearchaeota archaeon]
MDENKPIAAVCGVDRNALRDLDARVVELGKKGEFGIRNNEQKPAKTGFFGYIGKAVCSPVVRYGTVALLAFAAGGKWHDDVAQGYRSAKEYANRAIGYAAAKVFDVMPTEQKYKVIQENAGKMAPQTPEGKSYNDKK